jgi:hypothetical protein
MSQPRRRRRKKRRPGRTSEQPSQSQSKRAEGLAQPASQQRRPRRRRGRRGKTQPREAASPMSSEDLVRAPRKRPPRLHAPPDGQTLEGIIGELQSVWGVPQYPQEYRITIKVQEERDQRGEPGLVVQEVAEDPDEGRPPGEGPIREKAPAAPLLRGLDPEREPGRPRKRRRRRRGRGGRPPTP